MSGSRRVTAIGFSVHTGWAMAVAVSGPLTSPTILRRDRIDVRPGDESVEVFHVAAERDLAFAVRHVAKCRKAAAATARASLKSYIAALGAQNSPVAIAVVVSNAPLPSSLEAILRSHMQVHSAEGDFYRRAILAAGEDLDLKTHTIKAKELTAKQLTPSNLHPMTSQSG
jgi:hypothetical protein